MSVVIIDFNTHPKRFPNKAQLRLMWTLSSDMRGTEGVPEKSMVSW